MKDATERIFAALVAGAAIGLGVGVTLRLLMFAWKSTPWAQRHERTERAEFEAELRAFHDSRSVASPLSAERMDVGAGGEASSTEASQK